jgi:opacity protein-like surface antigen
MSEAHSVLGVESLLVARRWLALEPLHAVQQLLAVEQSLVIKRLLVVQQSIIGFVVEVSRSVFVLVGIDVDLGVVLVLVVLFFLFLFAVGTGVRLHVDARLRQLGLEQLEQLVGVVPAPLVENVRQEFEEVARVKAAFDLFDLFLRKGFKHLFAKRLGVTLLDRFLRRESYLADRSPVEVDFHIPVCSAEARTAFRRMPAEASRALTGSRRSRGIVAAGLLLSNVIATPCLAQELSDLPLPDPSLPPPTPPPISSHYLQYGVALTGETVASAGQVCPRDPSNSMPETLLRRPVPCILGNGGGLAIRVGYRSRGPWYLGGAYEFSRQDSANLLRLPILQQLRAELRVHLTRVTRLSPYLGAAAGGVVYGNEWGLDTWGGGSAMGAGLEFQVTSSIVLNMAINYRQLFLRRWRDGAGQLRADGPLDFGLAHMVALEFGFEIREPLSRW